ncbi:helix-turn-helix domain-containing protein [Methylocystis sp.]|uniref:helix-turn-helix domain-containing protein n=1 Tax=Methylocystis sp. TaxID=1911079 RepID=UPI003DA378E0
MLTVDEVAGALRMGRSTCFGYLSRGEIRSVMIGGKRLISAEEVARVARDGLSRRDATTRARVAEAGGHAPALGRGRPRQYAEAGR